MLSPPFARSSTTALRSALGGPWRLPHWHTGVLGYCKELGVPLELFVNENESSYYYYEGENVGPQEFVLPYGARFSDVMKQVKFSPQADAGNLQLFRVSTRDRHQFPSVLLHPLGHLSI